MKKRRILLHKANGRRISLMLTDRGQADAESESLSKVVGSLFCCFLPKVSLGCLHFVKRVKILPSNNGFYLLLDDLQ